MLSAAYEEKEKEACGPGSGKHLTAPRSKGDGEIGTLPASPPVARWTCCGKAPGSSVF